ncbi:MAG: YfhO family protein [Magnetococcales bacterium]|nr:hypothetical protein [Magnetococcales bacterium]NGZ25523.1 YfhO family protein [Magnetococcales bacterium]
MTEQSQHRFLLAIALACLLAIHWPMFSSLWLPYHDGIFRYQTFRAAYSEYLLYGGWPGWWPRISWGIPADFAMLGVFTPATWLTSWLAALMKVSDTLLIFQVSLFLDALFYTFGLILLTTSLYQTLLARLAAVTAGVLSLSWWGQPYFAFYAFYALPWVFYLLLQFSRTGDGRFFWLAGLMEIFTFMGNIGYLPPIHLLILSIVFAALIWRTPDILLKIVQPRALPYLALFLVLATVVVFYVLEAAQQTVYLSLGGREEDGSVSLFSFLTSGKISLAIAFSSLFVGASVHFDHHYYPGIMMIFMFFYAARRVQHSFFTGITIVSFIFLSFGAGGILATLFYFVVPGMKWYRHIGHLHYTLSLLLILAACHGIDHWLQTKQPASQPSRSRSIILLLAMIYILMEILITNEFISFHTVESQYWREDNWKWVGLRLLTALLMGLSMQRFAGRRNLWVTLLVVATVFDLAAYQEQQSRYYFMDAEPIPGRLRQALPLPYATDRPIVFDEWLDRSDDGMVENRYLAKRERGTLYDGVQTMDNPEWCMSPFRMTVLTKATAQLMTTLDIPLKNDGFRNAVAHNRANVFDILGCTAEKLWFKETAIYRSDESEAARLLAANKDRHPLIISHPVPPPATALAEKSSPAKEISGQLLRYSANLFALSLNVPGDQGGWLYYADSWSPYWNALVDGQPVPIYRANVGFKAILLPSGTHEIVWYYHHPRQYQLVRGLFLAGICFSLVWLGYLLWWWRRAGIK